MKLKYYLVCFILPLFLFASEQKQQRIEKAFTFHEVEKEKLKRYPAEIVWVEEKHSGIIYHRVVSGYTAEEMKRYNQFLKEKHRQKALEMLQYKQEHDEARKIYTQIGFVSADLFSYIFLDRFERKEEEVKSNVSGVLYDMIHEHKVTLDHIVALSKRTPIRSVKNEKRWKTYRKEVFAPMIRDAIFALSGWKAGEKEHHFCDYGNTKHWEYPTWYIAKEGGIQIIPDYSETMNSCKNSHTFILPLEWLEKHKNSQYAEHLKTFYDYKGSGKK